MLAGIDEAGRGPVIGPMVMAIAAIDPKDEVKLEAMGIKDSKLLSISKRQQLFEILPEIARVEVEIISPEEIDKAVMNPHDNLNWLEARIAAKLINKVGADKTILDCPSNNLKAYQDYIERHTKKKVIIEHKADLNHLIVGAGSVIAKVTRDNIISGIKKELGIDFGAGYPSDPRTQEFVKKYWHDPEKNKYMRKSWDTYKKNVKNQSSLSDF